MASDNQFVTRCHFRADGVFCGGGYLYFSKPEPELPPGNGRTYAVKEDGKEPVFYRPILVEDESVSCSACEGRGVILTECGKEFLMFFDTFLRAKIHETCADYIDDKMFGKDFPS